MNRLWISLLFTALACGATPKKFVLDDPIDHPFLWWPQTLVSYPVQFDEPVDLKQLVLTRDRQQLPVQFSDIVRKNGAVTAATASFLADLPSGGHREFLLGPGTPELGPGVKDSLSGKFITLDTGVMQVRLPVSQRIQGDAPGPVQQLGRDGRWFGASKLHINAETPSTLDVSKVASGPVFTTYRLTYHFVRGGNYVVDVKCIRGMDFVQVTENMEDLPVTATGTWTMNWGGLPVDFRQAANHPYPFPASVPAGHKYDDYPWEALAQGETNTQTGVVSGLTGTGELPFTLGIFEPWAAYRVTTFANFWSKTAPDALGLFIDNSKAWQDHEYSIWRESPKLQVSFQYKQNALSWVLPIAKGTRSTCFTLYSHTNDVEAMQQIESYSKVPWHDGITYSTPLSAVSHASFLQNRYGTINLNQVKDWVLSAQPARTSYFRAGQRTGVEDLLRNVMNSQLVNQSAVSGTRQNGGFGPTVSRRVEEFWIDGFERFRDQMTEQQRKRLTAAYLYIAYTHAGEEYMPMVPMLSGHPNFLADVKSVPPSIAYLFPTHPQSKVWAEEFEKYVELNTHYHARPSVEAWDAKGGRWTENLGTYVWAFLRPTLHADMLLDQMEQSNRIATPGMAAVADWLVNALSAPFNGETPEFLKTEAKQDNHAWGLVHPEDPRRVHLPIGAHSERRMPPRSFWYLGQRLMRFDPMTAEHVMWAAHPTDQEMELSLDRVDPFGVAYQRPDNRGTDPHLRSSKYTGYGITLRAGAGKDEISIHLQQVDDGPNYRWGLAGDGGTGVLYYFAGGKAYSFNGTEDVGDRAAQDTDLSTNFGVWKDGAFRSLGRNDLVRPMYDLATAQYAELLAKPGYSTPEYVGRSVLLAGADYFLLYDDVYNESVKHRFSWFVRNGEAFPNLQILRSQKVQLTELKTAETIGRWYDGIGDSLALISHRNDIRGEPTAFGARVRGQGIDDLVFRDPAGVHYAASDIRFDGTAGIVRSNGLALFHGSRIGAHGLLLETDDPDLGISASHGEGSISGEYYATHATAVRITGAPGAFYVDGTSQSMEKLPKGLHHWEITNAEPTPMPPTVLRTENSSGQARVVLAPVAAAKSYKYEISADNGKSWRMAGTSKLPEINLTGLTNDVKVHVRATAQNGMPGPEYPIYVTSAPPLPPEGLHLQISGKGVHVTWGELLGVKQYRLYSRTATGDWKLAYAGMARAFHDNAPAFEYRVSAVNGNGEGPASRVANTDPQSWRNFDPRPGEPFRRTVSGSQYYPK